MTIEGRREYPAGKGLICDRCGSFPHALVLFVGEGELMLCVAHTNEGLGAIADQGGIVIELHLDKPLPSLPGQAEGAHDEAVKDREEEA